MTPRTIDRPAPRRSPFWLPLCLFMVFWLSVLLGAPSLVLGIAADAIGPARGAVSDCPAGATVEVAVIDRDTPYKGRLVRVDETARIHLALESGENVTVAGQRVITVSFPGAATTRGPVRLDLVGGDVLFGLIEDENDDGLVLAGTSVPKVTVPVERLVLLQFPGALSGLKDVPEFKAAGEQDVVFRRGRDTVDRVIGTVDTIGPRGLVLETSIGEVPFKLADVVAIAFGSPADAEPLKGLSAVVLGADGSRISGKLSGSQDDKLKLTTRHGFTVTLATRHIKTIYFRGGDLDFISDLEPSNVVERSYWPGMVWRMRRDQTTEGRPLTIDGVEFAKGLGVHAYSAITYDLGGRYASFHASVGIDDEVRTMRAKGCVVFRVLVDGKEAYKSGLVRGLNPAMRLPAVNVAGAKQLTLVVEFGDDSHAGDRADWAMALLVRPRA